MATLTFELSPKRGKWFVYVDGHREMFGIGDSQKDSLADLVWNFKDAFNIDECKVVVLGHNGNGNYVNS